jgi:hypothetical protein
VLVLAAKIVLTGADPIQRDVVARTLNRRFTLQTSDFGVFEAIRFLDCTPDIAGAAPQEVGVVIERCRSHYRIVENGAVIREVLGARAVVEDLHVHLFRCSIEDRPQAALLHAACLRRGGRRLLLAGSTSAGKTTLALRLIQSGFEIEGDEHVLIDRAGVIARPRGCRVKTNALPLLPDMAKVITAAPSYTDEFNGKIFNVDPRILGSTWRIEQGRADLVIVLQPNHGGYSSIRPLPPSVMVQSLMSEIGLPATERGPSIAALAALAARAKAFDLSLGDHASAVRCVEFAFEA